MNLTAEPTPPTGSIGAQRRRADALAGVLEGTAVGDSLGLPMEGLSARRQHRLFPMPLRHRLLGRCGMFSDDTEHTFMLAQSLLEAPHDPAAFQRSLARRLRWWLLCLPAGVGFATLRAIVKLWFGTSPDRSGVHSAGNGPAMRSALLGIYFADDAAARWEFVRASAVITHRDPRACIAALAVAETAVWMIDPGGSEPALLSSLEGLDTGPEWLSIVTALRTSWSLAESTPAFARRIGAGDFVSGYAFRSVPVAIYAALRHRDDYRAAVTDAIACGGDTDTVAAITGALVGARTGVAGIPREWRGGIVEFPRSLILLERLAGQLARQLESGNPAGPVAYFWPAILFRNLVFLAVILGHGLRRLLPPY